MSAISASAACRKGSRHDPTEQKVTDHRLRHAVQRSAVPRGRTGLPPGRHITGSGEGGRACGEETPRCHARRRVRATLELPMKARMSTLPVATMGGTAVRGTGAERLSLSLSISFLTLSLPPSPSLSPFLSLSPCPMGGTAGPGLSGGSPRPHAGPPDTTASYLMCATPVETTYKWARRCASRAGISARGPLGQTSSSGSDQRAHGLGE